MSSIESQEKQYIVLSISQFNTFSKEIEEINSTIKDIQFVINKIDGCARITEILSVKMREEDMCDCIFVKLEYTGCITQDETLIQLLEKENSVLNVINDEQYIFKIKKYIGNDDPRIGSQLSWSTVFIPVGEKNPETIIKMFSQPKNSMPNGLGFRDEYIEYVFEE
jgi:hypothetical protein